MSKPLTMSSFITPTGAPSFPKARRGEGIYIWSVDGRQYLDGSSGAVTCTLGHGNQRVLRAMAEQATEISFAYARVWESDAHVRLTERLATLAGGRFDAAMFVSGGSEAVEASLKFARQLACARGQPQRWKIISRMPSYHGSTLGALSVTGDEEFAQMFAPLMAKHPKVSAPLSYRAPHGLDADTYARQCIEELERTIEAEDPDTVLAFIIEPVGGTATGALVAPDDYYKRIREVCTRHGVLLIFDEVMSCAGRAGRFLAAHYWSTCRPDIIALAKGLSSGYAPLGALLTSSDLVAEIRRVGGFAHGHTYAANPVSCAVGCAVLDELVERNLVAQSSEIGAYLASELNALKRFAPIVGDVRGRGLHLAVEIVRDPRTREPFPVQMGAVDQIRERCFQRGLMLLSRRTSGGRFGEWLMVCPPLITTRGQVDELVRLLGLALKDFQDAMVRGGQISLP